MTKLFTGREAIILTITDLASLLILAFPTIFANVSEIAYLLLIVTPLAPLIITDSMRREHSSTSPFQRQKLHGCPWGHYGVRPNLVQARPLQ